MDREKASTATHFHVRYSFVECHCSVRLVSFTGSAYFHAMQVNVKRFLCLVLALEWLIWPVESILFLSEAETAVYSTWGK